MWGLQGSSSSFRNFLIWVPKAARMERADENGGGTATSTQGPLMECWKPGAAVVSHSRRALRDIRNVMAAPPLPVAVGKRELPDKNTTHDMNPQKIAARRPMTRRFAASLANQPEPCSLGSGTRLEPIGSQRQKKPMQSAPVSNALDTSTAIDVDDFRSANDLLLPIVEEIENMVTCEPNEVEMEDLEEEPIPDIDSQDSNNPLAAFDYVEDIYSFYRRNEDLGCVCPNYMSRQFDVNEKMRAILIDWLIEVHYKFELMDETLFLTVNIIDRFLAVQTVVRKKLQLVGVTALLLACKYEEVSVPVVEDLILISDRAYNREEVLEMERLMVNSLKFNMSVTTPYVFMQRFLKAAQSDRKLELLSYFIIELCLVEYQMLKFRPSLLAAAAVYTAQCTLNGFKQWSRTTELHTHYSEEHLLECSRMMVGFHQKAGNGKLTGVYRKYSTFKFGCTAKVEPALFLLDTTD